VIGLGIILVSLAGLGSAQDAQETTVMPSRSVSIPMYDAAGMKAWASCAWEKLPVSAANLVAYQSFEKDAPKNDGIPFANGEETLNYRINAACGEHLSAGDRNAISPMVKRAKQRILTDARPAQIAATDADVESFVCSLKVDGRYVRTEFELDTPSPRRLPAKQADCFLINSDGSLQDA
tara:strand:+ start:84 stop:620 length:537 start_codon:yes stop_codon:yes gene_type:complete